MEAISVLYATLGYAGLVGAMLWGMLFVGDGTQSALMDTASVASPQAVWIDVGLLLSAAFLHKAISHALMYAVSARMMSDRVVAGTSSWVAGALLCSIYMLWQPLPSILWTTAESVQWAVSLLFYFGWTVIFIGLLLRHFDSLPYDAAPEEDSHRTTGNHVAGDHPKSFTRMPGGPILGGMLIAVWASSSMTVGHLLLASAGTAYSVLDSLWAVWKSRAREEGISLSVEGQRFSR